MKKTTPQVDGYIRKNARWREALQALRAIILETPLVEEVKWRVPCYTADGRNIVFLGSFKETCAISFVKGALLNDEAGLLAKPGENTQSARVIRFTAVKEIEAVRPQLRAYIDQAIAIEKQGLRVPMKRAEDFAVPEELAASFRKSPALKKAFAALTPGRQRGYLLHFGSAKQSKTRTTRIEKCAPLIMSGKGLHDD